MQDHLRRLLGFDDQGTVYDAGANVVREIRPDVSERVTDLVRLSQEAGLVDLGIVPVNIAATDPLTLEHPKYRVTYPHEWPAEMLRAACLLHLDLYLRLPDRGMDLKDGLPQNILFEGAEPVFVDFLSLVPLGSVGDEPWLRPLSRKNEDPRGTVLRTMFLPHFVIPLIALELGRDRAARTLLNEYACNVGTRTPGLLDIRPGLSPRRWRRLLQWRREISRAAEEEPGAAHRRLRQAVESMTFDVESDYSSYYAGKNEQFPLDDREAWRPKQRAVARILEERRPTTVLDLGCNTGWFSRLAASAGADVVAVDIDHASLNQLFLASRRDRLPITPVLLAYQDLDRETVIRGPRHTGEVMFTAAAERLACDLVLALGLVHHLALGEGRSLRSVMDMLSRLGRRTIVVEFVDLTDALITDNPGYFAHLGDWTSATYNLDALVDAAPDGYEVLSVEASHPASRRIVTWGRTTGEERPDVT